MIEFIKILPYIIVPFILCAAGAAMMVKRRLFDEFIEGIKEGLTSGIKLMPTLIALMTAVAVFNASGAAEAAAKFAEPLLAKLGVPGELAPLLIVRPVSGGASGALFDSLITEYGADSFIGRCASVIVGSSDTVIYITAVYFGSIGIRRTGIVLPAAMLTMLFTIFFACFVTRLYFG